MPGFDLSRRARGDLVEIGVYGAERWGDERSEARSEVPGGSVSSKLLCSLPWRVCSFGSFTRCKEQDLVKGGHREETSLPLSSPSA